MDVVYVISNCCKTHFYALEGWDTSNGWPTRKTLEGLGLGKIAEVMATKNRLGK